MAKEQKEREVAGPLLPNEPVEPEEVVIQELPVLPTEEIGRIREVTARHVALILVIGFLILMGLPFLYLFGSPRPTSETASLLIKETVDLIKTVSAVLSGLVGAVLMYYFGVERRGQN